MRCEIILGFSVQVKSQEKNASQYYKNISSDEDNFVFEGVDLNLIA